MRKGTYYAAHRTKMLRRTKLIFSIRKAKGLCVHCGVPAYNGTTRCRSCATKRNTGSKFVFSHNMRVAKRSGLCFRLTRMQWEELTQQLCHYCNSMNARGFNGLDRKDNTAGYTLANVVPCCWPCNLAKGARYSYAEFKAFRK